MTRRDAGSAGTQRAGLARSVKSRQTASTTNRRDCEPALPIKRCGGVWVFELPTGTPTVTSRQVKRLLDGAD